MTIMKMSTSHVMQVSCLWVMARESDCSPGCTIGCPVNMVTPFLEERQNRDYKTGGTTQCTIGLCEICAIILRDMGFANIVFWNI